MVVGEAKERTGVSDFQGCVADQLQANSPTGRRVAVMITGSWHMYYR
jgi:hypothetical protein